MRAPSMLLYRSLASGTAAAHEAHQAFDAAEGASLSGDLGGVACHLDDAVEAGRRMFAPLGYDLVPSTARRAGGA